MTGTKHEILGYGPMKEGERTIDGDTYPMSGWGWCCTCGAAGFGYASEDDAEMWAVSHEKAVLS